MEIGEEARSGGPLVFTPLYGRSDRSSVTISGIFIALHLLHCVQRAPLSSPLSSLAYSSFSLSAPQLEHLTITFTPLTETSSKGRFSFQAVDSSRVLSPPFLVNDKRYSLYHLPTILYMLD